MQTIAYPTLRKTTRRTRISCHAAVYMATYAAFYKESRMRFCGTHQDQQEIRGLGHPAFRGDSYRAVHWSACAEGK
jgi:hypothetical protein